MIRYNNIDNIGSNTVFLIRHSIRDRIVDPATNHLVPLNEEGKKLAFDFGKSLRGKTSKLKLFSSTMHRCVQTCESIAKGFGQEFPITQTAKLVDAYIADNKKAREVFLSLGTIELAKKMQNGEKVEGMYSSREGSETMLNLAKQECDSDCITIMISHDAMLAYFINHYTGEFFDENNWLDFLDGVVIQKEDSGTWNIYRNNKRTQL